MPPLDPRRLAYSLSGALLATSWSLSALRSAILAAFGAYKLRPPALHRRLLKNFSQKPPYRVLAAYLLQSRPFLRAAEGRHPIRRFTLPLHGRQHFRSIGLSPAPLPLPPRPLSNLPLPDLPTESALASFLGLTVPRLLWLADPTNRNRRHPPGPLHPYRYRWIPRQHNAPRLLEIPKRPLKIIQRQLLTELLEKIPPHQAAHAFRKNRSPLTNALPHCQKAVVIRFDLADFFPSITAARVFRIFRTLGHSQRISHLLMALCTTTLPLAAWESRPHAQLGADHDRHQRLRTRHLPQGAPTSPALANLAAHRLDRRLSALAKTLDATYTRYADDLTFSGNATLARNPTRLAVLIDVIARDEGFSLNHRKTRLMRPGVRQHTTGLTVNQKPNLPRTHTDRLKATLTNCLRHGPASQNRTHHPHFRAHLQGQLAHLHAIHPTRAAKLQALFNQISWPRS